ncbi:MAG: hypothetical protein HYY40_01185 [Bacteroidetes bacterium]|nr:hypothetical protein [Bacteroidota bacterium]
MNIESLVSKIDLFQNMVINSGFRRDIQDNVQSIQHGQNQNLAYMKDLSSKIKLKFNEFENYSLHDEIKIVLRDTPPFTDLESKVQLDEIDTDSQIAANVYYQKFNGILQQLLQRIDQNNGELTQIRAIFAKYSDIESELESADDQAIVSLVFKDLNTTTSLKEFSKVLNRWNRTLIIYHTLLKSESPDDIELEEIQNGSIDVIFNFDFDISIDLTELIKTGLKVYAAYLLYKSKRAREIIDSYMGNKKLIQMEKERENLMLDNIKESIAQKALEQHKEKLKSDKKIDKTGVDKKIEEVSSVITDHIIKGNEVKLLTPPEPEEGKDKDLSEELMEDTAIVRERYKQLGNKDKQLLLEKYSIKDEQKPESEDKKNV